MEEKKESLCNTCFNVFTRRWEKEDKSDTTFYESNCTVYPIKNVTHIIMTECTKYDEKKKTKKEFMEEMDGVNRI